LKRTRILLAGMPPLLRDIVEDAVAKQPDMDVLGHFSEGDDLAQSLKEVAVDVVIVGARQPDDFALADQCLRASPRVRVLVIANSGRNATMYEMRPHRVSLGDVSPEMLVAAIRAERAAYSEDAHSERSSLRDPM
jgi:DNA-binding NarL/FixJ family response regulator